MGINRRRKWKAFLKEIKPDKNTTILDVGFSENEYSPYDNYIEKHYPYPLNITALGIYHPKKFKERYPLVHAVQYDGDTFPFDDNTFDVCWSNAVIEHVGNREKQVTLLREITRVSRCAFVTTPNKFFPVEIHTRTPLLHFLPKSIFDMYLNMIHKSWAAGDNLHLLSQSALRKILKTAAVDNYKIIRNRMFFFTLDFVIVIRKA
jgi:SAM-dependent methyltransferase